MGASCFGCTRACMPVLLAILYRSGLQICQCHRALHVAAMQQSAKGCQPCFLIILRCVLIREVLPALVVRPKVRLCEASNFLCLPLVSYRSLSVGVGPCQIELMQSPQTRAIGHRARSPSFHVDIHGGVSGTAFPETYYTLTAIRLCVVACRVIRIDSASDTGRLPGIQENPDGI